MLAAYFCAVLGAIFCYNDIKNWRPYRRFFSKVGKPPRVGVIKEINPPDMLTGGILNGYVIVIWENETIMSTVKKNSIRLVPQASTTAALRSPTLHRSPQQLQTRPSIRNKRAPVITAASAVINDLLPASEREVAREKEEKKNGCKKLGGAAFSFFL